MGESGFRRAFCCRYGIPPKSPETLPTTTNTSSSSSSHTCNNSSNKKPISSPNNNSTTRNGALGFISHPRRILSPGRVSPIDNATHTPVPLSLPIKEEEQEQVQEEEETNKNASNKTGVYDVRLSLKATDGGRLVLELDSNVLSAHSSLFANLISHSHNRCRIEVPNGQNLSVFHDTIRLMFDPHITATLVNFGVSRSIDILEVAAGIMFTKGVLSCLKYLEAVPWSEGEEDKLKSLFTRFTFDDSTTKDVLARLYPPAETSSQQHLIMQLFSLVTHGTDENSRSELKSLVTSLLSRSSVYEKNLPSLNKEDVYVVFHSCLSTLVTLFKEASDSIPVEGVRVETTRPMVERISMQVDNVNWLLEILLDQEIAEEFMDVWADQRDLLRLHETVSPMIRYELSRISAWVFIALGTGKLRCRSETRCGVLEAWFEPMLVDFGWLRRCRKGLDIKVLETAMGQALLTLPMERQQFLFMEWFHSFSRHGKECPNLSKAFQIWWRRSSLKSDESRTPNSR